MIVDLSREDKNSNQRYKYCNIFASDASFSKQITFSTSAKIGESYDVLFTHVDVIFKKLKIFFFIFPYFFSLFSSHSHMR